MKHMKRWKNLAIAVTFGLVVGVQNMIPVQAAEVMPMLLMTCPKCNTALNVEILSKVKEQEKLIGPCTDSSHIPGACIITEITYTVKRRYFCPYGHYNDYVTSTETENGHINL